MSHAYGVSFNCIVDNFDIGGGGEGDTSLDYVGSDLDKIEKFIIADAIKQDYNPDGSWFADRNHDYVGKKTDIGGEVVSVIVEQEGDDEDCTYTLCVIFDAPEVPIVIK